MWGNYDTVDTANLMAVFDKCDNSTSSIVCKSEEEFSKWIEGKYFFAYWNIKQFVQDEFLNNRIM